VTGRRRVRKGVSDITITFGATTGSTKTALGGKRVAAKRHREEI